MSETVIVVRVTGQPVAQGRGRATVVAGRPVIHKPAKSRRWENDARQVAREVMGPRSPLHGCLRLDLRSQVCPPSSWPGWKRSAAILGQVRPTGTPDLDNLFKAAQDALTGVVWYDDKQVVEVYGTKNYAMAPSLELVVHVLPCAPSQVGTRTDFASFAGVST